MPPPPAGPARIIGGVHPAFLAAAIAVALFVGVLLCSELGYRWGTAKLRTQGPTAFAGASHIEGAIFALLGLLLAFNFAGAAGRLERRHAQLIEEANAVGTAWLRLDLLPPEPSPPSATSSAGTWTTGWRSSRPSTITRPGTPSWSAPRCFRRRSGRSRWRPTATDGRPATAG